MKTNPYVKVFDFVLVTFNIISFKTMYGYLWFLFIYTICSYKYKIEN